MDDPAETRRSDLRAAVLVAGGIGGQQGQQSSHQRAAQLAAGLSVRQQQRQGASRGSIRRTAVVLADDRFDRGDGPAACA
jgi:hypothetical protein